MSIAFNDLGRHVATMEAEIEAASLRVLRSGWFVLGPEVRAFEAEWAAYCGARHCISLATGTDALILGLRALDLQTGDEVLTVANAGSYTTFATHTVGATPRYVDVDPQHYTLDPNQLAAAITPRTKVIVPVHLYGQVANLEAILAVAADHQLPVLEDCAQAHGARYQGQHVGTFGALATFSFYPTKNLGALGDGGAIITNDDALAAKIKQLRTYGWASKYQVTLEHGTNSRLDELQAAILRVKLAHLDAQNTRRQALAARYNAGLASTPIQCPQLDTDQHVQHLYVVRVAAEQRQGLREHLQAEGIGSDIHYPIADHQQPAWAERYQDVHLPVTEALSNEILSLPCYPELSDAEVDQVISCIQAFFAK
ncbi:DegT/DnrJ/EryC1/StrS family aminotransferase [Herpetosiphon llansteffanensis]|uniref:DegT/DnrJ/EryC1/StrS family aminotransferase n=1 Tax=Herpetosiphon llansteffanensis TaxID=2094568 RepID=UPI000D7BCB17|nr:DegT/DnrJ/EryC1/StrS family aminotransferase [Herpetosiphon llansteffanensis]